MLAFLLIVGFAFSLGVMIAVAVLRVVRTRQALVICDHFTGNARNLRVGPALTPVLPFLDQVRTLDLTLQLTQLGVTNIVTYDGFPVAANLDVIWALDGHLLQETNLNQILPFIENASPTVRAWAEYLLRSLIARYNLTTVMQVLRTHSGLERLVAESLQKRLAPLGVRIHTVRLICQPEPTVLNARIAAQARAQELATLAAILGPQYDLDKIWRLELLDSIRRGSAQFITALDAPSSTEGESGNGHARLQLILGPR